jgi:hypothetical protein
MRIIVASFAIVAVSAVAACGGGGTTSGTTVPVPTPTASSVSLAAATSSVCVTAQTTPQTTTLPDTGGVTATIGFTQFAAGATGCQNVTIQTGAANTTTSATKRATLANSLAPILGITIGQATGSTSIIDVTTVVSGVTLQTDPNVVFPNGTYNATVTFSTVLGTGPTTNSLIFTAVNGKLVLTGGTALPLRLPSGAQLNVYDRGVVPPDFSLATPTPVPTATPTPAPPTPPPTATPTPVPTAAPTGLVYGAPPPPVGDPIGIQSYTDLDTCPASGILYTGYPCNYTSTMLSNGGADITLTGFPAPGDNGQVSYKITNFGATYYSVEGCDAPVNYNGGGLGGSFNIPAFFNPDGTPTSTYNTFSGVCIINLTTVPPNATGGTGYGTSIVIFNGSGPTLPKFSGPFPVVQPSPGAGTSSSMRLKK